jgi:hypothetical protein
LVDTKVQFRLKGHESFQIREGWLRKGIKGIQNNRSIFTSNDATDTLGVGTNMVKAIRFWLQACGITNEVKGENGKRVQELSEDFGTIINKYDPYFEDIFTLWLIHYKLTTNSELSTSWYLFFNDISIDEFTKEQLFYSLNLALKRFTNNSAFSERTLLDDCDCIIKTYFTDRNKDRNPEENTICPLSELGLLDTSTNMGMQTYVKKRPSMDKLDKMIVMYIILDNLNGGKSTSISNLLNDTGNVGKVLNLDRNILNEYLDILKNDGYFDINRTAGLDKIYIKTDMLKKDILEDYYKRQ